MACSQPGRDSLQRLSGRAVADLRGRLYDNRRTPPSRELGRVGKVELPRFRGHRVAADLG